MATDNESGVRLPKVLQYTRDASKRGGDALEQLVLVGHSHVALALSRAGEETVGGLAPADVEDRPAALER